MTHGADGISLRRRRACCVKLGWELALDRKIAGVELLGTSGERTQQLIKALELLVQSMAILDDISAFSVSSRVSMAVDMAKMELASSQNKPSSSVA